MKRILTLLAVSCAVVVLPLRAATTATNTAAEQNDAPTAQQAKMGSCSTEFKATGRPGSERQAFMKECLKKESDARTAQQNRMKTCSADFKKTGRPGAERQAFMKECLSN
ncbi:MAG TPA: PsiF family protein [Rubrivivax sp.]|nr:PsiF family protein [Burkholderiales bacterium]HNT37968.1 PsiF family protein [Rubrivivax sp.]